MATPTICYRGYSQCAGLIQDERSQSAEYWGLLFRTQKDQSQLIVDRKWDTDHQESSVNSLGYGRLLLLWLCAEIYDRLTVITFTPYSIQYRETGHPCYWQSPSHRSVAARGYGGQSSWFEIIRKYTPVRNHSLFSALALQKHTLVWTCQETPAVAGRRHQCTAEAHCGEIEEIKQETVKKPSRIDSGAAW